jgi:hypothetical protein
MTLVQFWTQERDLYRNKKTALAAVVAQLQQQLDKAKNADKAAGDPADGLKKAQEALTALDAQVAAKRSELAKATIPAAAQALVTEIRDLQIQQRIRQGEILDAQESIDGLQARLDTQNKALQRATARVAESEAQLKSADDAQKRRDKLKQRLAVAPLKDVPAGANAAKAGVDHNAAEARVNELPQELRTLAKKRFDLRTKRIADIAAELRKAEDELITQRKALVGDGKVEQERTAFARAEQAVQAFVSTAQSEFDRAVNLFKAIAATPLLSASETAAIPTTAARTASAGNAEAVNDAQAAEDAAEIDLEKLEFDKLAADADADLAADAAVTAKKNALTAARTTLSDASTVNYPDKQVTDEWQVVVVDRSWQYLVDFYDAKATLDRLAALSAAGAVTDMDNKEAAYAAVLGDLAKIRRRLEYVEDVVAERAERVSDLTAARPLRLVSSVRGDSF